MARTEPYHSAKLAVLLTDGRLIDAVVQNFGWDETDSTYVTKWQIGDMELVTRFSVSFHSPQFCPTPNVRAAFDYEQIEAAVEKHYGCELEDIEEA